MKKAILSVFCLLAFVFSVTAQESVDSVRQSLKAKGISLNMAYDDYKSLYNPRTYTHQDFDPYSPAGTGIASFFITGLGQMINGEVGRGFGMLGGEVGLVLGGILSIVCWSEHIEGNKYRVTTGGTICACCCFAGALGICVWSICDAVEMAKIKNLYARDCRKLAYMPNEIRLQPGLISIPTTQNMQYAPGVTLAVSF